MTKARVGILVRLRLWLIRCIRRSRFLPVGMPDKRADVDRLDQALIARVIVYFPTGQDTLYQLRPWLPAFRELHSVHPVTLVFKDSRTARIVHAESGLDCLTLATYGQLDAILSLSDVKLALYINHDPMNFECLRFTSLRHVYLGHGDSDKAVSVSNQVKAYDWCFLAGQAAVDRTAAHVAFYDAAERSVVIGQPQLDAAPAVSPAPDPAGRRTVLYAPTWEASQPSVSYGSVLQQGRRIVESLRGTYRVIYRPHPLNGVISADYAAADAAVRQAADRVDTDVSLEQSFADADILVTDVSAVPLNWLPSGKPMIITVPDVAPPTSRLLEVVPRLCPDDDIVALVAEELTGSASAQARAELIQYYLNDVVPGVATRNFIAACSTIINGDVF